MIKRGKLACFLLMILVLVTIYIYKLQLEILSQLNIDFSTFDNVAGSSKLIVPNIIHFVHFDKESPSFVTFVCILSAWYNHKPKSIYIHTNVKDSLEKSRLGIYFLPVIFSDSISQFHWIKAKFA